MATYIKNKSNLHKLDQKAPFAVLVRPEPPPGVSHDLVEGLEGLLLACLLDVVLAEFHSPVMEE